MISYLHRHRETEKIKGREREPYIHKTSGGNLKSLREGWLGALF